jgi:hypothetical protein
MDFDEAVNQALGPPEPPEEIPKKESKKKRKERAPEEEKPKKKRAPEPEEEEEVDEHQKTLYAQLIRYCEAFPECSQGIMLPPDAPPQEIEFQLATIQRRINAKNELGIMRAGLVTGCMLVEAGNGMVGSPVLLKGFGISVQASAEQFDDVLKQILCKYGGSFSMTCEATLGLLLLKHAATTHMVNKAAEAKKEPIIEELPPPPIIEEEAPTPDLLSSPQ